VARKRRRLLTSVAAGMAVGAAAVAVIEAVRPRPGEARIVDWEEIRTRAHSRLQEGERLDRPALRELEAGYDSLAGELTAPLLQFVGGMTAEFPPFQALDRHGWVDLNLKIMRDALDPLLEMQKHIPNSRAVETGRRLMDRYVGVIMGFLSTRVLGQYDPHLLGHEPTAAPGLYLVEPNINRWQEEAKLPGEPLRRWLILHEMTHAWQFAAHPWLREHLDGMIRELIAAAMNRDQTPVQRMLLLASGIRRQVAVVSTIQATMSLVEGYSNLVMDKVGRQVLPEFDLLEAAHEARVREKSVFEKLFWKVTGLELKLQQYVVGERFCKDIHDRHGIEVLNRAWAGADALPSAAELRNPDLWVTRILPVA
jgi:coenzyme F420 biosynthesis associated uncharacterized protein